VEEIEQNGSFLGIVDGFFSLLIVQRSFGAALQQKFDNFI